MTSRKEIPRKLWRAGHGWLARLWYEMLRVLVIAITVFGFSMRTRGGANMRRKGAFLVMSNHQSFLDPAIIGVASPRHLCFLARRTLFRNPIFAWLIGSLNAAPIDQESIGIDGLRIVLQLLKEEEAVVIFPEGERSPHGDFVPLKPGIWLLIRKMKAPIIPVGVAGAYEAWPRWRPLPHFAPLFLPPAAGTLAVVFGKPIDTARFAEMPREAALQELFAIMKNMYEQAEALRRR